MHLNLYQYGKKKDGYVLKILVAGFNGIADILWGEDFRMMNVKSNDGERCVDILHRLDNIAIKKIPTAGPNKDKHYFTGLMIRGKSEMAGIMLQPEAITKG
jgi:hypothetical protein